MKTTPPSAPSCVPSPSVPASAPSPGSPASPSSASRHGTKPRYHHGNLRQALVDAAVALAEREGVEQVSVREAARLAGVSPGAPFRHFATRAALLTAVAEVATRRLRTAMETALAASTRRAPLERFAAIGHAYLAWARANPTHFRIVSDRSLLCSETAEAGSMTSDNAWIREQMRMLLSEADGPGPRKDDGLTLLCARALVYGLARMASDGHFPEWAPGGDSPERVPGSGYAEALPEAALDHFIGLLQPRS